MNSKRRAMIRTLGAGVIAIPASTLTGAGRVLAADPPKLDPENATAKALAYTHESTDPAKSCAGCQFYTQPDAEWGHCVIFPDFVVSAKGLCNSWFARV